MTAAHTPGEWKVDLSFDDIDVVVESEGFKLVLARFSSTWVDTEMSCNARLMAASPDLLAAIEAFLRYDSDPLDDGTSMMLAYAEALRLAKDAYAKATGEAP